MLSSIPYYSLRAAPIFLGAIRDYSPLMFFGSLALLVFGGSVLLAGGAFVHSWRTGGAMPTSLIIVSVGGVLLSALLGVGALLADHIAKLKFQVEEALHAARQAGSDGARERHTRPSGGASVHR